MQGLRSCGVALLVLFGAHASAHEYKFTDLGTLGGFDGEGRAINARGQIAGKSELKQLDKHHAAVWKGKDPVDLDLPDSVLSSADGINDHGVVVGTGYNSVTKLMRAMRWHRGTATELGTLGGSNSFGSAVNRHGVVVGQSFLADESTVRGFAWADGVMVELPALGGTNSAAWAINANGLIAGGCAIADDVAGHACIWKDGKPTDLGTLGGRKGRSSGALAINDAGVAAGRGDAEDGADHALLFQDGAVIDLGTLGGRNSAAYGINNKGQVVGYSEVPTEKHEKHLRAVLWEGGTAVDLTKLLPGWARDAGWELAIAYAINDDGVITGRAYNKLDHRDHAFRLDPRAP